MTRPILHDYFRSSASYRVRIALNLKQVVYASRPIDLRTGAQWSDAYRALNPQGFVPMLEIDGLKLRQSLAIIDYLDARFPDPPMVPADPARRAEVLARALLIACDIHPLDNLRVLKRLARMGVAEPERDAWYRHWIVEGFDALEAIAAEDGGAFLSGETPGIADICLVPQIYNARRLETPLEAYPTLVRIDAALGEIEAVAAAHPDRVMAE